MDDHPAACLNYDPSHFVLQQLDYLDFIKRYGRRIAGFHVKDAEFRPDGRVGVYGGYQPWSQRAGRFRSLGDGQVDFGSVFTLADRGRLSRLGRSRMGVLCQESRTGRARRGPFIERHLIDATTVAFDDFAGGQFDAAQSGHPGAFLIARGGIVESWKRKLRMGMVGGGQGAFIGAVHRMAAALDQQIELVAGCFSRDPDNTRETGRQLYLDPARCYDSYEQMAAAEAMLPAGRRIDFVSIVTPTVSHFAIARAFLESGCHVVCDKPLTYSLDEARALVQMVERTGLVLALTHNYTGHPLVRHARQLCQTGQIGTIRKVIVEYLQDFLAFPHEKHGQKQASWRVDPAQVGIAGTLGEAGVHCINLLEYVTGDRISELCADRTTFLPDRRLEEDANILLRLDGGGRGILTVSQIATGEENNLRLRVYGSEAALLWEQENPNCAEHLPLRPAAASRHPRPRRVSLAGRFQLHAVAHGTPGRLHRSLRHHLLRCRPGDSPPHRGPPPGDLRVRLPHRSRRPARSRIHVQGRRVVRQGFRMGLASRWRMRSLAGIVALIAVFTLAIGFILIGSISEEIKARLGIDNSAVGSLAMALFLTSLAVQLFVGLLVDKLGHKIMAIVGFLATSAAIFLLAAATNLNAALTACSLLGVGAMCVNTVGNTLLPIVLFEGKEPARASNFGNGFVGLAFVLTPLALSALIRDLGFGYTAALSTVAGLVLVLCRACAVCDLPGRVDRLPVFDRSATGARPAGTCRRVRLALLHRPGDLDEYLDQALRGRAPERRLEFGESTRRHLGAQLVRPGDGRRTVLHFLNQEPLRRRHPADRGPFAGDRGGHRDDGIHAQPVAGGDGGAGRRASPWRPCSRRSSASPSPGMSRASTAASSG